MLGDLDSLRFFRHAEVELAGVAVRAARLSYVGEPGWELTCASDDAPRLYDALRAKGVEVLFDDRNQRPGVKFKDADLIGLPVRLVVGAKSLKEGQVEISLRRDRERQMVAVGDAVERILGLLEPS